MAERQRSIAREERFEDELSVWIRDAESADEFTAAAEEILSRDPQAGVLVDEGPPEVWLLPMPPIGNASVSLFYSFDAETVSFLSIQVFDLRG